MGKCREILNARSKSNPANSHLIADCQLPIADLIFQLAFGNWKSTIGNVAQAAQINA
jgi:hypothetical protein